MKIGDLIIYKKQIVVDTYLRGVIIRTKEVLPGSPPWYEVLCEGEFYVSPAHLLSPAAQPGETTDNKKMQKKLIKTSSIVQKLSTPH